METYRYDLHVHTKLSSACAHNTGAEMADMYKAAGYAGFVVTDHFFCGNTSVPRELPWEEWVARYHLSYEDAKKRGDEIGLDVFFGWEFSYQGTDFVTLGLDTDWLLAHPEVTKMDARRYLNLIRESGGYIIHAHPFMEAGYIPYIRLMPRLVDAVEIRNGGKPAFVNEMAAHYAESYDLTVTGGSDSHNDHWGTLTGVEFDRRITSVNDLTETLKLRQHRVFAMIRQDDGSYLDEENL